MRQLCCTAPGRLEWADVPDVEPAVSREAVIRPVAVARCDLDPLLIAAGPSAGHFAIGHEAVAEVVEVGSAVTSVAPGDLVAVSFQLSCGVCSSCAVGRTALCEEFPILSDYGMQSLSGVEYGGMLSDFVKVPYADAMLVPLPPGVDPVHLASVSDNLADGFRAVAPHLADEPGAPVLIVCHGGRSIALYAAMTALALGSETTFASDDEEALEVAATFGATPIRTDLSRRDGRWPIVVECGTTLAGLHYAVESTIPEGLLHSVSFYAEPFTPMPLGKLYTRGIRFHTGRVHSAALLPQVLATIGDGRLNPAAMPIVVTPWESAAATYLDDAIKLVVAR